MELRSGNGKTRHEFTTWASRLAGCAVLMAVGVGPDEGARAQAAGPQVFEVAIKARKVDRPGNLIRVKQGDLVELKLVSDEQVELNLHGYDLRLKLAPDVPGTISFNARLSGRFPLESHGFGTPSASHRHRGSGPMLYLEVLPR